MGDFAPIKLVRRHLRLKLSLLVFFAAISISACGSGISEEEFQSVQQELQTTHAQTQELDAQILTLQDKMERLSFNTASGGGVNMKYMPDPVTGEATVALPEVFSFNRSYAMCRVDTNPQAFKMNPFEMGEVTIEPHQFYMSMVADSIDPYEVSTEPDGARQVTMTGGLDCFTEVGQVEVTFGSRTAAEHATYLVEAVDRGRGGGEAGDSFAFTVFFNPQEAPINHAIFGPEFTFTGELVEGEITIVDPDTT